MYHFFIISPIFKKKYIKKAARLADKSRSQNSKFAKVISLVPFYICDDWIDLNHK